MKGQHFFVIRKFGAVLQLDHPPDEREVEFINHVCESRDLQCSLELIKSTSVQLSQDSLTTMATCAFHFAEKAKRPDLALTFSYWAVEIARKLTNPESEASILFMHIGLLLSNKRYEEALAIVEEGKRLCAAHEQLSQMRASFAEAERRVRVEMVELSIPRKEPCDVCGRTFRIYDGARHIVLSRKHETYTQSAHCFACSIVLCFACAEWRPAHDLSEGLERHADFLKTPHCPFCGTALGEPQAASSPPLYLRSSLGDPRRESIQKEVHAALSGCNVCELVESFLEAESMKTFLRTLRSSLGQIQTAWDSRLSAASERLREHGKSVEADVVQQLLSVIRWVRDKQNTPTLGTQNAMEFRPPRETRADDDIEMQLLTADRLLAQDDLARALHQVRRARETCLATGDNVRLARSFLIEGSIRQRSRNIPEAIQSFEECLKIALAERADIVAAKAHGNLAGCFLELHENSQKALEHSHKALSLYRAAADDIGVAKTLNNIGAMYLQGNDPKSALPYLQEALDFKKKAGDMAGAANTLSNIAIAKKMLGDKPKAVQLQEQAVEMGRGCESPLDQVRHSHNKAKFLAEANDPQGAIESYEQAFKLLEDTRAKISDRDLREKLFEQFVPGFHHLSRLYLEQNRLGDAVRTLERIAAVDLCEFMTHPEGSATLKAPLYFESVSEFPLPDLDDGVLWEMMKHSIPTAVVQYAFVQQEMVAFIALPGKGEGDWMAVPIKGFGYKEVFDWFLKPPATPTSPRGGWFAPLHDFRGVLKGHVWSPAVAEAELALLLRDRLISEWEPSLRELGQRIFTPILEEVRKSGAHRICFIPVGLLSQVPLHAMQWNDNGNWATVINEFEVQYAPSLRVLQLCFERTVQPMSHALIVANPVGDLPLAHTEAQILVRILPHCQILEGSQGTLGGICRNSHGCGIVHLATHGTYDALSASRSGLLLASEPETRSVPQNTGLPDSGEKEPVDKAPDYGQLVTIHQIFDEAKVPPGALVVLSACDSGTPLADTRGERFISLAAGFLAAGASGVICSQWPVSDLTSVLFMALFYSKFRSLDSVSAVAGTARTLRSLTAEGTCRLWNSYFSDALDCGRMDVAKLGNALGLHLEPGSNPFDSPYFWGSFNVWGRACPAISRG